MEEQKDKDVAGGGAAVPVKEQLVANERETATELACKVDDQVQGSESEPLPFKGEDVMVGSDVVIDGASISVEDGDNRGKSGDDDVVHCPDDSVDAGVERDNKSSDGGTDMVIENSSGEIALIETEAAESLVVRKEVQCLEENTSDAVDKESLDNANMAVENSASQGTRVSNIEMASIETEAAESLVLKNEVHNSEHTSEAVEHVVVENSALQGTEVSSGEMASIETEAAESLAVSKEVQCSVEGFTKDSSKSGNDSFQKDKGIGGSGDEVTVNMVKPDGQDASNGEPQCEVENVVGVPSDVPGSPSLNQDGKSLNHSEQISANETASRETQNDNVASSESKSVDGKSETENGEQKQENVAKESVGGHELKSEECLDKGLAFKHSEDDVNTGEDMEIDKQVVNVEDQQLEVGTNSKAHGDVNADSENPISPTQTVDEGNAEDLNTRTVGLDSHTDSELIITGQEMTSINNQEATNSNVKVQKDHETNSEDPADSTMDIDEDVTLPGGRDTTKSHNEPSDTLPGGQDTEVQEQLKVESAGGTTESHIKPSGLQPTAAVVEVAGYNDQTDPRGSEEYQTYKADDLEPEEAQNIPELDTTQEAKAEEEAADADLDGSREGMNLEIDELDIDMEDQKNHREKQTGLESESFVEAPQARYQLPTEQEGEFSVFDLVWGKVRSHPWWPGQIFDPSDASEKATKYHRKDSFLVAYFGDQSFAWNEESLLKPFKLHFSSMEDQNNSEAFQNAVNCALEELSRRVMLGLVCPCIPDDVYDNIKFQMLKNAGIEEESSKRDDRDKSTAAESFAPDKLLEYIKDLAESPSGGADQLELVTAKAQLLAYYHSKGCYELPEFLVCGDLLENNADASYSEEEVQPQDATDGKPPVYQEYSQRSSYHRRKHNLKAGLYPSKKQRSLSELMIDPMDFSDGELGSDGKAVGKLVSPSSIKKRKVSDSFVSDSEGRKTISVAKVSLTSPNNVKPSFKIGECIRRAASQMTTGSPSILKGNNDKGQSDEIDGDELEGSFQNSAVPNEYSSLDDLLSQLLLAALDPKNKYNFLNVIISFFSDFRNSLVSELQQGTELVLGKRKMASEFGAPATFEFDDKSDTYWTDRVIHNGSEEQPSRKSRKRENQPLAVDSEKSSQAIRRPRKRYSDGNHGLSAKKPDGKAPAELVMNFSELQAVPSEAKLNMMFKHFGAIKESQTEVDKEGGRARIVFRKSADAEVAYNSAGKFNIFGAVLVNYQLNYTITETFKPLPMPIKHGDEYATLYLEC